MLRDERKKYLKNIGIEYAAEEMKEIKDILKTDISLEKFKECVTPLINERELKKYGEMNKLSYINIENLRDKNIIIPLKVEQIREIRAEIEKGKSYEEIDILKKNYLIEKIDSKHNEIEQSIEKSNENREIIKKIKKKLENKKIGVEKEEKEI